MLLEEGLKLPVKLQTIYNTRDRLKDALHRLTDDVALIPRWELSDVSWLFSELLGAFTKQYKSSDVFQTALHRTLENFLVGVDQESSLMLQRLPSVLAGNLHELSCGQLFAPPTQLQESGYCLAVIRDVCPVDLELEKHEVTFELLTGRNASETKHLKYVMYVGSFKKLMKTLGVLRKFAKPYERKHPRQLVGCYAFIHPVVVDGYDKLKKLGSSGALKTRNKQLMESRLAGCRSLGCEPEECGLCDKGPLDCHFATRSSRCVLGYCYALEQQGQLINEHNPEEPSIAYQICVW